MPALDFDEFASDLKILLATTEAVSRQGLQDLAKPAHENCDSVRSVFFEFQNYTQKLNYHLDLLEKLLQLHRDSENFLEELKQKRSLD